MVSPVREMSVSLLSFEKDALKIVLELCPTDRAKDSLLSSLRKAGMSDGNICIDAFQNQYLQKEIPLLMGDSKISGSKLDSTVGRELMPILLAKIGKGF